MTGINITAFSKISKEEVVADEPLWVFGRSLGSQSKTSKDQISLAMKWGRSLSAYSKTSTDFFSLFLSFGRAIQTNAIVGRDDFQLLNLFGKVVYPPMAELYLLKDGQETSLLHQELIRGDFYALNLRIIGDRIASEINGSMNVTFTGKLDPSHSDEKAIFRKTLQNGGIKYLGVEEVATYKGKTRAGTYQIRLTPSDTSIMSQPTWIYSDIQVDDGMRNGERYTVTRLKFKIVEDVYKGVGGNYP